MDPVKCACGAVHHTRCDCWAKDREELEDRRKCRIKVVSLMSNESPDGFEAEATPESTLRSLVREAAGAMADHPRLEVRDSRGRLLDHNRTVDDYGFLRGEEHDLPLFIALGVGRVD